MTRALLIIAAVLLFAGGALRLGGGSERLLHPARFAVTGATTLSPDRYADAVARAAPTTPLAALRFPTGERPVVAEAERATLWLDPPTALVLDRADRVPDAGAASPLADPSLGPAAVLAGARAVVGPGPRLAELTWPTLHRADWQVRFDGGAVVDVADDSGFPARAQPMDAPAVSTPARWGATLITGAALLLLAGLFAWTRRRR